MVLRTLKNLENLELTWNSNSDLETVEILEITWDFVFRLLTKRIIVHHLNLVAWFVCRKSFLWRFGFPGEKV